ncbi:bifunctional diaminohydroxyphosphoribosylaminopyrimidine deaminase/5-amino-6-(5-phosphoribosylamino)uracil reductase RibD [Flavobacterium cerinum]|uniref:Riboflavin biosynthesis protein RibD n=1 Tax=Flavobacterium cerinum TaxID=2502784 RepID=A0ABY5ITE9_9FLAO|nr:bifunctional diaminohydroxyphosphoribosylaminopyrimidine deaminase/5-amino-6-(5-phosphoribosylamino)uracil reductase RibD [Flavobacterium cerinum]UUC45611.1 bifunctional diaminohydroxyphosphoribosylaminopyrimidine deaminase/5-amino-6-(5-phosphoribosylamino)uracil reductase RibD [Flavobacterium cerinum]
MKTHEYYINRCIELARNGLGTTYPNPLVGSVIVHDGKIIGEGWHQKAGQAHAEVNAVNAVKDKTLLSQATIYVSLEPCSHFGKTPPCCDLIIHQNIPNVVIGTVDPFAKVAGNGIRKLTEAGKNVTVGILEEACDELNKRFFTFHQKKRPYIILKWAESQDGFIAPLQKDEQKPVWISNTYSRQLVHKWRSEEQAILVGTQTVIDDNPQLNTRDWSGNNPIRVVLDRTGRIPAKAAVKDGSVKTFIFTEVENPENTPAVFFENCIFDSSLPFSIVSALHQNEIQSILIEGGRQTLQLFIDAGLWDEARVFKGAIMLNEGIKAPVLKGIVTKRQQILNDELLIFRQHD